MGCIGVEKVVTFVGGWDNGRVKVETFGEG
jgi:hypothetical protein